MGQAALLVLADRGGEEVGIVPVAGAKDLLLFAIPRIAIRGVVVGLVQVFVDTEVELDLDTTRQRDPRHGLRRGHPDQPHLPKRLDPILTPGLADIGQPATLDLDGDWCVRVDLPLRHPGAIFPGPIRPPPLLDRLLLEQQGITRKVDDDLGTGDPTIGDEANLEPSVVVVAVAVQLPGAVSPQQVLENRHDSFLTQPLWQATGKRQTTEGRRQKAEVISYYFAQLLLKRGTLAQSLTSSQDGIPVLASLITPVNSRLPNPR